MTAQCGLCKRRLRQPSPDGLGPKCRRKLHPPTPRTIQAPAATTGQLDHQQLTAAGQLTIPENPMPYTDDDLRHEAARQLATTCEDPDFMGIGERMVGSEIESYLPPAEADGAEGMHWDDLDREDFDAAQRGIDDLLTSAADLSTWAVEIGADGLEPYEGSLTLKAGQDKPIVRVHIAFDPDMPDDMRTSFVEGLAHEIASYL